MLNLESDSVQDLSTTPPQRSVTPLDVRQTTFQSEWRGYDKKAVNVFLQETSESFERALRENERMRQELTKLDGVVRQYKDVESTLNNTLVHAQKISDDMRATAQAEADRIVREAKGKAELVVAAAQNRLDDAQREIDALRMRRREAESNVEAIISTLHGTLEFIRDQQRESIKLVPSRPRIEAVS